VVSASLNRCPRFSARVGADVPGAGVGAVAQRSETVLLACLNTGDARADQGIVADEPEGEADQDRREGSEPRPLYRFPNGRGRHPTADVPGDFVVDRGTTTKATTTHACLRWLTVQRSKANERRPAP